MPEPDQHTFHIITQPGSQYNRTGTIFRILTKKQGRKGQNNGENRVIRGVSRGSAQRAERAGEIDRRAKKRLRLWYNSRKTAIILLLVL